uniref:galaxin-like n=1 Tax=Scatophagus argus TaxID=75038 RepID=UPI001ED8418C|nr:galaxin-like [Scatophagus argus]
MRTSKSHECCGVDQYDTKTQCCCFINNALEICSNNSSCCVNKSGVQQQKPGPELTGTEYQTSTCESSYCNRTENSSEFCSCEKTHIPVSQWSCPKGQSDGAAAVYDLRTRATCYCREPGKKPCTDQFHGSKEHHCCGPNVYQLQTEICCDGHRHPRVEKDENMFCCEVRAYNIENQQMKCCAGTLYNMTLFSTLGYEARCCGSILQKPEEICCMGEDKEVLYSAKTGFRCCGHLYYNTSLWSCCTGNLSPLDQPGYHHNKTINESRLESINNLNETDLCKEMLIGIVESVCQYSIVFSSVLKIHEKESIVKPLESPYILQTPNLCSLPKLIPGKTYFFDGVNFFIDSNHDSILKSLHFIIFKCSQYQIAAR